MAPKPLHSRRKVLGLVGSFIGLSGCISNNLSTGGGKNGDGRCQTSRISGFSTNLVSVENAGIFDKSGFVVLSFKNKSISDSIVVRKGNNEVTRHTVDSTRTQVEWRVENANKKTNYTVELYNNSEKYDYLELTMVCQE